MDKGEFRALTTAGGEQGGSLLFGGQQAGQKDLCVSCHGDERTGPVSDRVPVLQGQSAAYLDRALDDYRHDRRQSGIMEPIAAALDENVLADLARAYASMDYPTAPLEEDRDRNAVVRGQTIAETGIPEQQLPACLACHSGRASAQFPMLAGLSAEYLRGQLKVFRKGLRDESAYGAIMTSIAMRLTGPQIDAVAAYFSSLPLGAHAAETAQGAGR
jgi:cytochrome c553